MLSPARPNEKLVKFYEVVETVKYERYCQEIFTKVKLQCVPFKNLNLINPQTVHGKDGRDRFYTEIKEALTVIVDAIVLKDDFRAVDRVFDIEKESKIAKKSLEDKIIEVKTRFHSLVHNFEKADTN